MPVVPYGVESSSPRSFDTRASSIQFVQRVQRQVLASGQEKIASLSFEIDPIAPWVVLAKLGAQDKRHFYYDSPQTETQNKYMVGIGAAIEYQSEGPSRFSNAQAFTDFWRQHLCIASLQRKEGGYADAARSPRGHFFCSATFFSESREQEYFAPAFVFVPKVQVTTEAETSVVTYNTLISGGTDVESLVARIVDQLGQILRIQLGRTDEQSCIVPSHYRVQKDVDGFEQTVRSVLSQVRSQQIHKVVLSDVADVVMPAPVDVVRSLQALRQQHPHCTVFSVGNGQGQSFIGASPERLLRITKRKLMTEALAGTTSRNAEAKLDRELGRALLESQKERYEHQVVVEFILAQLRSLGITAHGSKTPQLLRLSNIQHLHTPITASLENSQASPLEILSKLHPTPAVAGVPRQQACSLIQEYESFDRGLYTAPIGWIDTEGDSEFIVGIRSALIDGCKARLYAGAGIVSASEPERELAEIRLKLQALLNALVCS